MRPAGETLRLSSDSVECGLQPQFGGTISRLSIAGFEVLRRASQAPLDPLASAAFPMVPFANRLFPGTRLGGTVLHLPPDAEATPAALHGHGWRRAWQVDVSAADGASLSYCHAADDWPWTYRARQHLALLADGLQVILCVENLSDRPMPVGLGIHPYMTRSSGSFIDCGAMSRLVPDERGLPAKPGSWRAGVTRVGDLAPCDSFLIGDGGAVRFGTQEWSARIDAAPLAGWQLYCPGDADYYCLEPVSHRPGNIGGASGGTLLDPGQTTQWACTIRLE